MTGITIAAIIAVGLVARWIIEAMRTGGGADGHQLAARDVQIQRLREEVDLLSSEVRRLGEEQSFMVKLLSAGERPGGGLPAAGAPENANLENP